MKRGVIKTIVGSVLTLLGMPFMAQQCLAVSASTLRHYATRHSIGIEWDVTDDPNHNAICSVRYKKTGASEWESALPLFRVDFNGTNMLAGSIFSLNPGMSYDVRLEMSDPDGGGTSSTFAINTLLLPVMPKNGRTLYVIPGSGGGSGLETDPFCGIAAAQAEVVPGDTVLLGAGTYPGETEFSHSGEADNYVVWKAKETEVPILETIRVNGDHIWFDGLHVEGNLYGIRTYNDPQDIVVTANTFIGCHDCIYLNHGGTGWFIADNTIVGDVAPDSGSFSGEGVELQHSNDHTVMNNSISMVADGVSYPGSNCDIFANEIFNVSDDGIEPDYGYSNIRVWGNRISNAYHNGISFQPMNGAPWYIFRNQVAAPVESALKFRDAVDRALIAHNTFIGWQGVQKSGSNFLTAVQSNNNLWISMTNWYAWENGEGGTADWRTNLDYDGFSWGTHPYAIKWGSNNRYSSLTAFYAATGMEEHGVHIDRESCFTTLNIPASPPAAMEFQYISLNPGCNAVDAGIPLANINDGYLDLAPDLGAYEVGTPLPHYGPRQIKGDFNADQLVTAADSILVLQILADQSAGTTVLSYQDVDGDSKIGMAELLFIMENIHSND